ncbi:MAG: DUF5686 family protein, partial [Bacteroidaceae bacterium]
MKCKHINIVFLFLLISMDLVAQIKGTITDSLTREPLSFVSVYYQGKGVGSISKNDGQFVIETRRGWNKLTFSAIGYRTKVVNIVPGTTQQLNIRLASDDVLLDEVVVRPGKEKYSRKNNPAVEFMRKVIAHKSAQRLNEHDFYQYRRYEKMVMSLNDVTPEEMEKGVFKKLPFLKDRVEVCAQTNKLILPVSIQETVSRKIYRRSPHSEKTIIEGLNTGGINELFSTGDALNTVLNDVFADINIYDNDIRLLQKRFVSPISSSSAISFYKYYLMDTVYVNKYKCVHLTFVPQNSQDYGFTGHLYVLADSTYAVKKCTMNLPKKTGVNFVNNLDIVQEYEQLPSGEWVLKTDDMLAELYLLSAMQ